MIEVNLELSPALSILYEQGYVNRRVNDKFGKPITKTINDKN